MIRMQDLTFPYEADPTLTIVYEYDFGDCWRHLISFSRQSREEGATTRAAWRARAPARRKTSVGIPATPTF